MLPADQRLQADDLLRREVDQRLVVEPELVPFEGASQVVLELDPLEGRGAHLGLEQDVTRAGGGLRPNERDLRLAERVGRLGVTRPGHRDAEARVDVPVAVTEQERRAELGQDPLGRPPDLVHPGDPVDDDPELVAAEAGHGVARPDAAQQPFADGDEERVADGVTEALVDHLEPVEVEQDQGHRVLIALAVPRQGVGDPVGQQVAVGQARDGVVQCAALRLLEQVGVVQRDRGELGEAAERSDLAAAERPLVASRGEPDDADGPAAGGQRHGDDGTEHVGRQSRRPANEGVVILGRDRAALANDEAAEPVGGRQPVAEEVGEDADPVADDECLAVGLEEVDEPVGRADQRGGPGDDRLEEVLGVVPVHQRDRGLVEGRQVRVAARGVGILAA